MTRAPASKIFFTSIGGYSAEITGDEPALRTIEEAFASAGFKLNEQIGTWDEGFYAEKSHGKD